MATNQQSQITPPPELVQQWLAEAGNRCQDSRAYISHIATQAARWGADQELEACCEWLSRELGLGQGLITQLRAARRPKPPSLKREALEGLAQIQQDAARLGFGIEASVIVRALEALPDDN